MNQPKRLVGAVALAAVACTSPMQPSAQPTPPAPSSTSETAPAPVESFVYYRMAHAGPMEQRFDEVRLDREGAHCFQAYRRLFGAISFEAGEGTADESAFAQDVERLVKLWKQGAGKGAKPPVFLHAHAEKEEAATEKEAMELAEKRAQTVQTWLVNRGIPKELVKVQAHGWESSLQPLQPLSTLVPNRRVEISHDATSPSTAQSMANAAMSEAILASVQQKVRGLGDSIVEQPLALAPQIVLVVKDGAGQVEKSLDVASLSGDGLILHRYFLQGLSSGCRFEALP